jgi:hypothetical protein
VNNLDARCNLSTSYSLDYSEALEPSNNGRAQVALPYPRYAPITVLPKVQWDVEVGTHAFKWPADYRLWTALRIN